MVQFLVNLSMHPASCKLMGVPMSVFTFTSGFLTWEPDRLCLGWNKQTAEQLWEWLPSSFWPYYVPSQLHLRWSPNGTDLEANCPLCTLTCRPWLSTLLHLLTRTVGSSLSLLHSCALSCGRHVFSSPLYHPVSSPPVTPTFKNWGYGYSMI